jgi:hypothetical protein
LSPGVKSRIFLSPIHQEADSRTTIRGRMDSFNQDGALLTTMDSVL